MADDKTRERVMQELSRAATARGYRLRGEREHLADAVMHIITQERVRARQEERQTLIQMIKDAPYRPEDES